MAIVEKTNVRIWVFKLREVTENCRYFAYRCEDGLAYSKLP